MWIFKKRLDHNPRAKQLLSLSPRTGYACVSQAASFAVLAKGPRIRIDAECLGFVSPGEYSPMHSKSECTGIERLAAGIRKRSDNRTRLKQPTTLEPS